MLKVVHIFLMYIFKVNIMAADDLTYARSQGISRHRIDLVLPEILVLRQGRLIQL